VVTLVVEAGEAEQKGVTVGSMIMSINGESVIGKTYKETLDMVKLPARPMRIVFEKESPKDEVIQVSSLSHRFSVP
jgi:C-terminal processing protease CtpA/Prc